MIAESAIRQAGPDVDEPNPCGGRLVCQNQREEIWLLGLPVYTKVQLAPADYVTGWWAQRGRHVKEQEEETVEATKEPPIL